jgi:hypothetical protein
MGRTKIYKEDVVVRLTPDGNSKLQLGSDRRAIVQFVLDEGGITTIKAINNRFGFDTATIVKALVHSGWFSISQGR